jgi:hypothetical protein
MVFNKGFQISSRVCNLMRRGIRMHSRGGVTPPLLMYNLEEGLKLINNVGAVREPPLQRWDLFYQPLTR